MEIDLNNIDNLNETEDNEDDIQLTPAEVIELMEEAWLNEKFAPEILPHKSEIVDCLLGQITCMENNLENLESTDIRTDVQMLQSKKNVYQLEVDRLRFLVTSYLRTRVEKIETYVTHILSQEAQRSERGEETYLTEQELRFAKDFSAGLEQHFEDVTSFYPGLPAEDWRNQPVIPNIHSFVFLKSKKEVEGIAIDDGNDEDGDLVDLNHGSQMIISYHSVSNLVKRGDVHLI